MWEFARAWRRCDQSGKRLALAAEEYNAAAHGPIRRGVGVAGMWYGCGNTSLPNPSTVRVGLKANGRIALHQGAVDIGQGSNTIVTQICADALRAPVDCFDLISGDTAITPDCGKTSASRQTFVTGKAAQMAGKELRHAISETGERVVRTRSVQFEDWRSWKFGRHKIVDLFPARLAARSVWLRADQRAALSIRRQARLMRTGKVFHMLSMALAHTWRRSPSTLNSAQ